MTYIAPVPTTRVTNQLANTRLTSQLDADLVNLQKIESQVSTGLRLNLPSDDPDSALAAVGIQRMLNQTNQVTTNLQTNQSYLSQTDSALASVSNLLSTVQSTVSSVVGSTATAAQQQAAADQVNQIIQQLVQIGNQNFDGRYLFSGSETGVQPFSQQGQNVAYSGNAQDVSSFSDVNQLFQTNVSGAEAFGAISTVVNGTASLAPTLTADTPLADLNGGQGLSLGSIQISDGTHTSTVDLSDAATVGDVAAAIEANPPAGRAVRVDITPTGLNVSLDAAGGGNLSIAEVGTGDSAHQLGIFDPGHVGTGAIVGTALNPALTTTTPLADILGTRAAAVVSSSAANSGLVVQAKSNGPAGNGYTVQFVDNHDVSPGGETVAVNAGAQTITVDIDSGHSTANDVINALNNNPTFAAQFTASLDTAEPGGDMGGGAVDLAATATTTGGSGTALDQTSGLQVVNGGTTYNIDISSDKTVGDLLNTLNGAGASLLAQINSTGTGINILSRLSGSDFSIGENGGTTAAQLGVRTFTGATTLAQLNYGQGVQTAASGADFTILQTDGSRFSVSLAGDKTIQDVIDTINNNPDNQNPANDVHAQLAATGNGIELVSNNPSNANPLTVIADNSSTAAQGLGLIPAGQTQSNLPVVSGNTQTITGADTNPQETDSVFNALVRLQTALQNGDTAAINRGMSLLSGATANVNEARANLGAREQSVTALQTSVTSEQNNLQSALSSNIDVDMATAITNLTAQQVAYQASLQITAQLSQLTLSNFL